MKPGSAFVLYSSKISAGTMSLGKAPGSIALILIGTFLLARSAAMVLVICSSAALVEP